jgi:hypothetical protein
MKIRPYNTERGRMNKDYISGMKLLLKESKIRGVNIRQCQWIPHVSKMMSERNLCYKFWRNVVKQERLREVLFCENWYDVLFNKHHLFDWFLTEEGYTFWNKTFHSMLLPKGLSIGSTGWNIETLRSLTLYQ